MMAVRVLSWLNKKEIGKNMMKGISVSLIFSFFLLCSCHETMTKRAAREAAEYTEKYCPTPIQNCTRTDSVVFDDKTNTFIYYCSIFNELDDKRIFDMNKAQITESLLGNLKDNTQLRAYKKEGPSFRWIITSAKNNRTVYFDRQFTVKDYAPQNTIHKN